jgi:GDP-L-fucose synthase
MIKTKILLTGGGGMVGRNLLEHPAIGEFELLAPRSRELDLRDFRTVRAYLRKHQPDMIVHAAGKVGGIQANISEPVGFLMENLDMGRNIVWAAHQAGIKCLINLGSSCMYPRNHSEPLHEEMVLKGELEPTNEGYALAKVVTARLCDYIMREDASYQYKTLIPCNLYGRYDSFDPVHSHLLPAIIHKVHLAKQSGQQTVEIWGDGNARREFMYAGDLADAVVQAINNFVALPTYMNVGLGHDFTINEYYQAAAEVMGYTGSFVHDVSKPVGMARKLVNIERQKAWGWNAQSDLYTGLEKTYEFYLKEYCSHYLHQNCFFFYQNFLYQ